MQSQTNESHLGNVLVLGFGRTGFGVAEYLVEELGGRVSGLTLYGGAASAPSARTRMLETRGVHVVCGTDEVSGSYDLAIVSPGIPPASAFFESARACAAELIGEPEFAWRESPHKWIGITGTNGKTTTTLLITELLRAGGLGAKAVGNVGVLATGQVVARERRDFWFVAELSSFQLATTQRLHVHVGCFLNVSPDHLEWHGSLESYAQAKERLFQSFDEHDLAVVSCDDVWCRQTIERLTARGLRVCVVSTHGVPDTDYAAFVRNDKLVVRVAGREHVLVHRKSLSIKGDHNVQNALVASATALELGVSVDAVCHGLLTFQPLSHRIEPCGTFGGVQFVNDSKATNVDSVKKALTAFEPGRVVLLLGGHDKGTELETLAASVVPTCRVAVCYGEAGPRIAEALRVADAAGELQVIEAPHLSEAFDASVARAHPKDVVLLSPACSSFDEFSSFEERGDVFKNLVAGLGRRDI